MVRADSLARDVSTRSPQEGLLLVQQRAEPLLPAAHAVELAVEIHLRHGTHELFVVD